MLVRRAFSFVVPRRAPFAAMSSCRLLCQAPSASPGDKAANTVSVRVRLVEKLGDFCDLDRSDLPVVEVDVPPHLTVKEHFPALIKHPKIKPFVSHVRDPKCFTLHWERIGLSRGPDNELHKSSGSFGEKYDRRRLSVVFPSAADLARHTSKPPPINITRTTPLILLNVRGVVNLVGESDAVQEVFPDANCGWYLGGHGMVKSSLNYSPQIIRRVNKWAELGAEVRWLTRWGEAANTVLAPRTGVHQFAVCPWKQWCTNPQDVFSMSDLSRPIVWVDDDLGHDAGPMARAMKNAVKGDLLLIDPRTHKSGWPKSDIVGLTDEMADEVDAFIHKWVNASGKGGRV